MSASPCVITNQDIEFLIREGSMHTPFAHNLIPAIREGWHDLLDEPGEYRSQWTFAPEEHGREIGYFRRDGLMRNPGSAPDDFKQFFHFYHDLPGLLASRRVRYQAYDTWMDDMEALRTRCARMAHTVALGLDRMYGLDLAERLRQSEHVGFLRLLSYDLVRSREARREMMGKGHTDGSYLTLHIWDEYSCLMLGREADGQILHQGMPDTALVFFGNQAEKETRGMFKSMYHAISGDPALVPADARTRDAIIYFADLA
jgi:isopenicillin N synthase-like dioxygenase